MSAPAHITLVHPSIDHGSNAIDHYCAFMQAALEDLGLTASRAQTLRDPKLSQSDAILLQYNPFDYGRWGFAPVLALELARLRRQRRRPLVALVLHEVYVDMNSVSWTLMGAWQRAQLLALRAAADVTYCTIDKWVDRFSGARPRRPIYYAPVGANVPDRRSLRNQIRRDEGWDADTFVVATFGGVHPSKLTEWTDGAARAIATSRRTVLLNLGADADPRRLGHVPEVEVATPGMCSADRLGSLLAASDLFLTPFIDGVSAHRCSVMGALRNGLPVLGTVGPNTDRIFRNSDCGLALVPATARREFVAEARRLAESPDERSELAHAGVRLFDRTFDWPVLAERQLATLSEHMSRR